VNSIHITFGSVCSGIEAASVAWHPLGWRAAWLAEIELFPCQLLAHHYPEVPNLGDMTTIAAKVRAGAVAAPDVLVGGTPCQAFSLAGLRNSLADARGQLTLSFVDLANAIDSARHLRGQPAATIVWENVPGVLNTKDNAFGCFLGALAGEECELEPPRDSRGRPLSWPNAGCVFGPQRTVVWRVLDAQYFGVAQRRRRVFVIASARDGFDPTEILFECDGVRRDSPPRRGQAQDAAAGTLRSTDDGCDVDHGVAGHLQPVAGTLQANGKAAGSATQQDAEAGMLVPIAFDSRQECVSSTEVFGALGSSSPQAQAVCITGDITHTLKAEGFDASEDGTGRGQPIIAATYTDVRRLTPRECERLQSFPDDYTLVPVGKRGKLAKDGPRYKALGNSMCVYNMRWIGRRIDTAMHQLQALEAEAA
jgi:DNA (cytosine-5)-methyltransferase 1